MHKNTTGQFFLDGMIEGSLSDQLDEQHIKEWIRFSNELGINLVPAFDGGSFSLLADSDPTIISTFENHPVTLIEKLLIQLSSICKETSTPLPVSTLRSREIVKNAEIQSLYQITLSGEVKVESRTVEIETVEPPQPVSFKQKMLFAASSLVIVAIVFIISTFFIDYATVLSDFKNSLTPFDQEQLVVEYTDFDQYIKLLEPPSYSKGILYLYLGADEKYPRTDKQLEKLYLTASFKGKLALESIAKGYISYEAFDSRGAFIGRYSVRIANLQNGQRTIVKIPLSSQFKPAFIRLAF